ncbi:MAG TPA: hypothetical protein VGL56_14550 [Fimbriimonadaceae bacterium]
MKYRSGFVKDAGRSHLQDENSAIQAMFTTDRLAHIEKADAEIESGEFVTEDEVDEHFAEKGRAWLKKHDSSG